MKSPIKDSLNFRCGSFLKKKIDKASIVHSFLFYSGTLEVSLAQGGRFVVAHTNKYPIYEFWTCAMHDPRRVATMAEQFYPVVSPDLFEVLQQEWATYKGHYTRAGLFFLLNWCSSTGDISCGELNNDNFSPHALRTLRAFDVENLYLRRDMEPDYLRSIDTASEADVLLFPVGKYNFNLFEEGKSRGPEMTLVNHKKLKERLQGLDEKWLVVYKYHPRLLKEYKDYETTMISKYGQPTKHPNMCEDIVIANF